MEKDDARAEALSAGKVGVQEAACAEDAANGSRLEKALDEEKNRKRARVAELPAEAREAIEGMLSKGCRYQEITDALNRFGFVITQDAIGRHEAAKKPDARQAIVGQLREIDRWMKKHPEFDLAGSSLMMLTGKLFSRLEGDEGAFDSLPADKAASALIQAARAITQYEKTATGRKKDRADARRAVVAELREALGREPELLRQIEALVGRNGQLPRFETVHYTGRKD